MNTGYQVVSKISEIELLPKERYQHMFNYFKNKGRYAHNMMKGTAALHINLDYCNEEDFRKKIRTAYFLSPLVYYFLITARFLKGLLITMPVYGLLSGIIVIMTAADMSRTFLRRTILTVIMLHIF